MNRITAKWIVVPALLTLLAACDPQQKAWEAAQAQGTVEAYEAFLEQYPDGSLAWQARFAIGEIFESGKRYEEAMAYYANTALSTPDVDSVSVYTAELAKLEQAGEKITCSYKAQPQGLLKPLEGAWGRALPADGEFAITGSTTCQFGSYTFSGVIDDWAYLYTDSSRVDKVGWGIVVTAGSIIIPKLEYTAFQEANLSYISNTSIEAEPLDYLGKYVRTRISPGASQRLVIPIALYPAGHDGRGTARVSGSVYMISSSAKDADSGMPAQIHIETDNNVQHYETLLFRTDDGTNLTGMTISPRGERTVFNADYLALSIVGASYVQGAVSLIPPCEEPNC